MDTEIIRKVGNESGNPRKFYEDTYGSKMKKISTNKDTVYAAFKFL